MLNVKTIETENNIYQFSIGYRKTAKTTYEQQEERRKEIIYMTIQKTLGAILILIGVIPTIYYRNIFILLCTSFLWVIGIGLLLSKEKEITF
jgi:hypothetical protein